MRVSIVIPAHNEEASIGASIRAVLAQDYPDFEVIVVDNASTDRTSEVARAHPVRVVHEPKKGLLHARERGRREATGEIIFNIDADCLPEPDWLARGTAYFADPSVVAVTGPYDYHDGGVFFRRSTLIGQQTLYKAMSEILQHPWVRSGAVLIGGNTLVRSAVLEKTGGYNTDLTFYGEDTDTAKRVARHGRIVFDPRLAIKTSARRFKSEGTVRLTLRYWYHFFKHILKRDK